MTGRPPVRLTVESPWCERQEDSGDTGRTVTGAQGRAARPYRGAATDETSLWLETSLVLADRRTQRAPKRRGYLIPRKAATARSEEKANARQPTCRHG